MWKTRMGGKCELSRQRFILCPYLFLIGLISNVLNSSIPGLGVCNGYQKSKKKKKTKKGRKKEIKKEKKKIIVTCFYHYFIFQITCKYCNPLDFVLLTC